jgi:hypothetical protein
VLGGFLGTYTSRYSDYQGYWLFGFLVGHQSALTIDLLSRVESGPHEAGTAEAAARALAVSKFHEQLAKSGLPVDCVAAASLVLERIASASTSWSHPGARAGVPVRFRASVTTDTGRTFVSEATLFVAPHDPTLEQRSG